MIRKQPLKGVLAALTSGKLSWKKAINHNIMRKKPLKSVPAVSTRGKPPA
jgi:hypothetical protein